MASAQTELGMEVERKPGSRTAAEYGARYGLSVRQVMRYRKRGRDVEESPPFDDPLALLAWCERWMTYKPAAGIRKAAEEAQLSNWTVDESMKEAETVETVPSVDIGDVEGVVDLGLPTMRKIVAVKGQALSQAYAGEDKGARRTAEKEFNEAVESLRKLEATQLQLAKAGGDLVPWDEVEAMISSQAARLGDEVLVGMLRFGKKLAPEMDGATLRKLAEMTRDEVFQVFKTAAA